MSGLGSSPAVRITDRMFLAPSMSLHKDKDKDSRLDHRYRSLIRKVYKKHKLKNCSIFTQLENVRSLKS